MLVVECIIIENKSVQAIPSIHEAQLLTYLKLLGHRLGLLVNWNVPLIKGGVKRMVNGLWPGPPSFLALFASSR
jgi:GxxExxY protein